MVDAIKWRRFGLSGMVEFICESVEINEAWSPDHQICETCETAFPFGRQVGGQWARSKRFCSKFCRELGSPAALARKVERAQTPQLEPKQYVPRGAYKETLQCVWCNGPFEFMRAHGQRGRRPKFCSEEHRCLHDTALGKVYWAQKPKLQKVCLRCGNGFEATNKPAKYCPACVIDVLREAGIKNTLHQRKMATCEKCGDSFRPYRPGPVQRKGIDTWPPKLCGKCRNGKDDKPRKRRKGRIANAGRDRQKQQLYILERDDYYCHLCGLKAPKHLRGSTSNDRAPEVDHIVTYDDGGTDDLTNLACSHRGCNRHKGRHSKGQMLLFG